VTAGAAYGAGVTGAEKTTAAPGRARSWSIAGRLDPRHNSLNLVRLVLAGTVLVAHSFPLTANGQGYLFNNQHLGTWAVYCFFCLSGFLITGSRLRTRFGEYLSHRISRIFPAFLVSLVVVAFGFAPIAYLKQHGSLDGFLTAVPTPFHHLVANFALNMREWGVAGTILDNPYPMAWNGSLWSLYYEFICYLVVGAVLSVAFLRKRPWVLVVMWAVSVVAAAKAPTTLAYFGNNGEVSLLLTLLPWFLGGATVHVLRGIIPLAWWTGIPSGALFIGLVVADGTWGPPLSAPLLTVFLLWVGNALPSPALLKHHDISYGVYIYAFPSQQLVAAFGGAEHGPYVHAALSVPTTVLLAIASWLVIERPAMRAARGHKPARNEGDVAAEAARASETSDQGASRTTAQPVPEAESAAVRR